MLPNGEYAWQAVATAYQAESGEAELRDTTDLKKHWHKVLCNGGKKPTGKPGENTDRTHRCIAIERKIMEKTHAGMMGIQESEDEDCGDEVEEEVLGEENALRRSPPHVSKTIANRSIRAQIASNRVPTAEIVGDDDDVRMIAEWEARRELEEGKDYSDRIDDPPSPIVAAYTRVNAINVCDADGEFLSPTPPSVSQSVHSALKKAAEKSPPMSKSIRSAMAKTESHAKAEKTKNSSNKSKERTSIAGSIAKMIDRIDSSSNANLTANMNMMLMRQMEEINCGMMQRYKEERRERKREKKRRRKRRERRTSSKEQ
mgnify:CR=1 FL=1